MEEVIRVVMFGKIGVGKSLLGNKILGKDIFSAQGGARSLNKIPRQGVRVIDDNCRLVLVDTPGLFDTSTNDNMITAKILANAVKETKPGPHIFLFVLSIGRFTAEERATIEFLKDLFGSHVTDYLIVIFTGKDNLDFDKKTLETYIKGADKDLKSIVSQCQGMMAINNRASHWEVTESVNSLLRMIKDVYRKNKKRHYTDDFLVEAENTFEEDEKTPRRVRELEAENTKLRQEKDRLITQQKTEFKEYQDKLKFENEKLQEEIRKVNEQNQNVPRKQEEVYRRERELEDEMTHLAAEKDRIITQQKTEFKEYQDKLKLENEKLQEEIRKVKEPNQIALHYQEEAHRRERELEAETKILREEKNLITTKYEMESNLHRLKYETVEGKLRKVKEQNQIVLRKKAEELEDEKRGEGRY